MGEFEEGAVLEVDPDGFTLFASCLKKGEKTARLDAAAGVNVKMQAGGFFAVELKAGGMGKRDDALVKLESGKGLVGRNLVSEGVFGPCDEESFGVVDATEPVEIDIASIEDVDAVRNEVKKEPSGSDIRPFAIGDNGKRRNLTS